MALSHARGKAESACLLRCLVIPGGPSPPHLSAQAFGLVHRLSPAELQLERVPPPVLTLLAGSQAVLGGWVHLTLSLASHVLDYVSPIGDGAEE